MPPAERRSMENPDSLALEFTCRIRLYYLLIAAHESDEALLRSFDRDAGTTEEQAQLISCALSINELIRLLIAQV
ncbi:uncharacterized protein BDZ99DRAFT_458804 [Mytilinidion resinicola]|uniref:Uncharacterized protein n=1 Tax=Mytilinidion resinicola TaxID=574789 RepID=A0A6A6Z282_9PEZI|nr:uncharacterized protein BDZ99DRAFT_458804 [Mytilinidion resinicola]KAF2814829.1 hypothetical protein BDZ99DRAFT_458804 [Mytilinidion resinicola]